MLFSPSETVVAYGLATSSMRLRRTDASSAGAGLTPRSESRGGICAFYTQARSLGAPPARGGAGRQGGGAASGGAGGGGGGADGAARALRATAGGGESRCCVGRGALWCRCEEEALSDFA